MNPLDVRLEGVRLIEASAGTGKTWTVSALVTRLIVEGRAEIDDLVVVTFTRAATHELRDRIRTRLVQTRRALAVEGTPGPGDTFLAAVLERTDDREGAARRLDAAVRRIDEAAILTIHGFCRRVLSDRAFEAGAPFESELVHAPDDILQEVVDDHWRARLYDAEPGAVRAIVRGCGSPDALVKRYRTFFGREDLEIMAPPEADLCPIDRFHAACTALRCHVVDDRDEVARFLHDSARWRKDWVEGRLDDLAAWLVDPDPTKKLPGKLEHFTRSKRKPDTPEHEVWAAADRVVDTHAAASRAATHSARAFEADLVRGVGSAFRRRKRARGVVDYDDLLHDLRDALAGDGGATLAARIRARYPFALVDEFQDTDPVQWEIFERIYRDAERAALVLVGDPKQSIYGFRGADVFAYLRAARTVDERIALDRNWRSHPDLVAGVNATFSAADPFANPEITLTAVEAGRSAASFGAPIPGVEPGFVWRFLPRGLLAGQGGKGVAENLAAEAAATETARMMSCGVAAGAIAVLVRSGFQGRLVRDALRGRGMRAVLRTHESVFAGDAARDLGRILSALAAPAAERRVRAALATVALGLAGHEIVQTADDGPAWERTLERFRSWHGLFRERGPALAIREVFDAYGVESRLLGLPDGERRLTDLGHLVERVQAAWDGGGHGFERLLRWYVEQVANPGGEDDDEMIRLESDEDLVRIETVHASKGLEYDYVLCPFVWSYGQGDDPFRTYHREEDGRFVLDLRDAEDPVAAERADREHLAEDLRLLYVALTRAKRRCEAFWIPAGRDPGLAAPAWLLHDGPRETVAAFRASTRELDDRGWIEALRRIEARAERGLRVVEGLPDEPAVPYSRSVAARVSPRTFDGSVRAARVLTSFSALAEGRHAAVETSDRPDWDFAAGASIPPVRAGLTRHSLPAGVRAGRALHQVFETVDFEDAAESRAGATIRAALAAHGFDAKWEPAVAELVSDALRAAIDVDGSVRLAAVPAEDRLVELEFVYPVAALDGPALARALREHGGDARYARGLVSQEAGHLGFRRIGGHLRGFIDLLFRASAPDGTAKYWIVDWKSNRLGDDGGAYGPDAMADEVARHAYWLQYVLYTVAVHRLLGRRVPGYDYDRHFGGVAYLFVRGVDPADPTLGVHRDRLPRATVEAVDRAMAEGAR